MTLAINHDYLSKFIVTFLKLAKFTKLNDSMQLDNSFIGNITTIKCHASFHFLMSLIPSNASFFSYPWNKELMQSNEVWITGTCSSSTVGLFILLHWTIWALRRECFLMILFKCFYWPPHDFIWEIINMGSYHGRW